LLGDYYEPHSATGLRREIHFNFAARELSLIVWSLTLGRDDDVKQLVSVAEEWQGVLQICTSLQGRPVQAVL
jgi:hypothetical protein